MSSSTANANPRASPAAGYAIRTRIAGWFARERALVASLWALGLMLTVPFLAPFKAPPVASFHPEAIAAAFGLLALSVLPLFASRLELPQIGLLPLGLTAVILIQ